MKEGPMFLMMPDQHREWTRLLRQQGLHDKADRHEPLARAIEIRQQTAALDAGSRAAQKKAPRERG